MGVASGWVGSSAKYLTGEQWMSAAGKKLKLSTPFNMSQMVGRSMQDFSITVGRSTFVVLVQATNTQWVPVTNNYGWYSNNSTTTGAGSAVSNRVRTQNPAGSISGSLLGCAITHLHQAQDSTMMYLGLTNGPNQNFTLSFGGTNIAFTAMSFSNNTRHYRASVSKNWLFNQNGKTISVSKV